MKTRLPIILLLTLLASCQKNGQNDGEASTSAPKEEKSYPWDFIPDDPALANGRKIYLAECSLCHNKGYESSPALTRTSEWDERSKKGEATLISHAINGFNGEDGEMPARGGTPSLTDEEVANAVRYMLATPKP